MEESQSQASPLTKYLQELELSQECKELISTLPNDKGWFTSYIHQYQGFWYNTIQLQGILSCQKNFQAQDTDTLLATNPKSGTTWLKALTFVLLNRKSYPPPKKLVQNNLIQDHPLVTTNPQLLVPFLEIDHFNVPHDPNKFSSTRLLATHLPYVSLPKSVKDSNCKIVYLWRDPKDTFTSLWHFAKRLGPQSKGTNSLEEYFDKFCKGMNDRGTFWDHVLSYWKARLEKPEKVMFLRFEDMKMKPSIVLKDLAEFMGCPFSQEEEDEGLVDCILELCSFENLSNLEVNKKGKMPSGIENNVFFRRGEIGDAKNHLTVEMIEKLDAITEKKLGDHGLKF